jgi:hypothetical protein
MSTELSEFASTLHTLGTVLCVPLGSSLEEILRQCGFHPDQEVIVRFGKDRVVILPRNTIEEILRKTKLAAGDLREVRERIWGLMEALPAATHEDVIHEDADREESPEEVLLGTLECLIADDLSPAIDKLESLKERDSSSAPVPEAGERRTSRAREQS